VTSIPCKRSTISQNTALINRRAICQTQQDMTSIFVESESQSAFTMTWSLCRRETRQDVVCLVVQSHQVSTTQRTEQLAQKTSFGRLSNATDCQADSLGYLRFNKKLGYRRQTAPCLRKRVSK